MCGNFVERQKKVTKRHERKKKLPYHEIKRLFLLDQKLNCDNLLNPRNRQFYKVINEIACVGINFELKTIATPEVIGVQFVALRVFFLAWDKLPFHHHQKNYVDTFINRIIVVNAMNMKFNSWNATERLDRVTNHRMKKPEKYIKFQLHLWNTIICNLKRMSRLKENSAPCECLH